MMTPLVMDYPQDENTDQLTRQYMFCLLYTPPDSYMNEIK